MSRPKNQTDADVAMGKAHTAPKKSPPPPAPQGELSPTGVRVVGRDFVDQGTSNPEITDADRNKIAEREMFGVRGDPVNDRFKVITPIPISRVMRGGVVFHDGVGYTGSEKAANICRGLGYEVIDRNPPVAIPPAESPETSENKSGEAQGEASAIDEEKE